MMQIFDCLSRSRDTLMDAKYRIPPKSESITVERDHYLSQQHIFLLSMTLHCVHRQSLGHNHFVDNSS